MVKYKAIQRSCHPAVVKRRACFPFGGNSTVHAPLCSQNSLNCRMRRLGGVLSAHSKSAAYISCCNTPLCGSAGAPSILCKRSTKPILCFSQYHLLPTVFDLSTRQLQITLWCCTAHLSSSSVVLFAGKALPRTIKAYRNNRLRGISISLFYPELRHGIRDRHV